MTNEERIQQINYLQNQIVEWRERQDQIDEWIEAAHDELDRLEYKVEYQDFV